VQVLSIATSWHIAPRFHATPWAERPGSRARPPWNAGRLFAAAPACGADDAQGRLCVFRAQVGVPAARDKAQPLGTVKERPGQGRYRAVVLRRLLNELDSPLAFFLPLLTLRQAECFR